MTYPLLLWGAPLFGCCSLNRNRGLGLLEKIPGLPLGFRLASHEHAAFGRFRRRGALPLRGRWPGAAGDRLRRRRLRARLVPRADAGGSPGRFPSGPGTPPSIGYGSKLNHQGTAGFVLGSIYQSSARIRGGFGYQLAGRQGEPGIQEDSP